MASGGYKFHDDTLRTLLIQRCIRPFVHYHKVENSNPIDFFVISLIISSNAPVIIVIHALFRSLLFLNVIVRSMGLYYVRRSLTLPLWRKAKKKKEKEKKKRARRRNWHLQLIIYFLKFNPMNKISSSLRDSMFNIFMLNQRRRYSSSAWMFTKWNEIK